MLNIITHELPEFVTVGGTDIAIASGFRTSIQVARMLDSGHSERDIRQGVLLSYFGSLQAFEANWFVTYARELLDAAMGFYRVGELESATKSKKGAKRRTFDWDEDQIRVVADFEREYALDLTDDDLDMHWWRFMALFEGLSDESRTMTAIGYRAAEIPRGATVAEQERVKKMRKLFALPPRTKEEVLARDAVIWGD